MSAVNAYQKCPPNPRKRIRAERNSAQCLSLPFSAPAALEHAIRRIPDNFQRVNQANHVQNSTFSTRSKNKEKFSRLDCVILHSTMWVPSRNRSLKPYTCETQNANNYSNHIRFHNCLVRILYSRGTWMPRPLQWPILD